MQMREYSYEKSSDSKKQSYKGTPPIVQISFFNLNLTLYPIITVFRDPLYM